MQSPIDKNKQVKYILETLSEMGFDLIYSLITTLQKSNSLHSNESCQITLVLLANKEN